MASGELGEQDLSRQEPVRSGLSLSLSPGRSASTSDIHNDNCSVSLVEFDLGVHAVEEQIPELLALDLAPKHGLDLLKTLRLQVSHSLL